MEWTVLTNSLEWAPWPPWCSHIRFHLSDNITGDPLHSRAACTQPCNVNTHSRAHCSLAARLCEQWGHGCVNNGARLCASARLCRGSPVNINQIDRRDLERYRDISRSVHDALGFFSIWDKTSYRKISQNLEGAGLTVITFGSFWNLAGLSAAALPTRPTNFRLIALL